MAQIPRPSAATPLVQGSFGRERVNAPVEAFGTVGVGEPSEALTEIGKVIEQNGEDMQKSNIARFKTLATNMFNEAAIKARQETDQENVEELFSTARKGVEGLKSEVLSTDEGHRTASEWLEGEYGRRSNQQLGINIVLEDRNIRAQDKATRQALKDGVADTSSLIENKFQLQEFWSEPRRGFTEEEAKEVLKQDLRDVDLAYSRNILQSIDEKQDSYLVMQDKLNAYETFVDNAVDLNEEDKLTAQENMKKVRVVIEGAKETQIASGIVGLILPDNINELDEIKSDEGQLDILERAKSHTDNLKDVTDPAQRERISGMVTGMLQQQFAFYDEQRKQEINRALTEPDYDVQDLLDSNLLNANERSAVRKVYEDRVKEGALEKIRGSIVSDIGKYDPLKAKTKDTIKLLSRIWKLSPPERKVYTELIDNKRDAQERGPAYKKQYQQLEKILLRKYMLTGDDLMADKSAPFRGLEKGAHKGLTPTERVMMFAEELTYMRNLAEKHKDNPGLFEQEATKYMELKGEEYLNILHDQQFRKTD